jgi:predicted chitinase
MKQKLKYFIILLIVNLILAFQAKSQVYPVQLNTQLIPPYSLRLSDYVAPGTNRIGLNMLLTDLNELNYQVRLELTIEGNGITIKTSPLFNPQPIILDGGVPQYFTSSDLAAWFDPQNLDFSGYSKSAYLSSGRLPEGVYRFYFTALDYNKHIRVSNNIPVTAWLMLNDPPLINLPFPNHKVEHIDPQNIVFQWTPRHTASPNSAFSAEYEFTLVEIWPEGRDPNNAIQTSIPVYQTTTTNTTLVYGLAEPFLEPGKQYAYRVQARDVDGRDMFKNNGYSEVRMFTFGEECKPITNITAEVKRFNEATISWTPGFTNTSFTVRYRKANTPNAEWFEENRFVSDVTLNDLQAQTTYEYQVMAYCGTYDSDYSDIQTFTTPEPAVSSFECGKSADSSLIANTTPLPVLRKRDFIWSGDFMVQITEVSGGNGNFSGKGLALVPYLGFVKLAVEFENIKVNTEKQVFEGEIKSVYNPNSPFIFTVDLDGSDYDSSGDSTITTGGGGLNDTTFVTDIDSIFIDGDNIIIVNDDGTTDTIPTTDDIIITDSNGDTWVVENGDVIVGDGNGPGGGSGSGSLPVADVADIKIKLEFLPYENQEYGFDKLSYDIHKDMYEQASVYGEKVYLPWKSLSAASMDRVLVKFSNFDTTITPAKVKFRTSSGTSLTSYAFEGKNDQRLVLLNGQTSSEAQAIEAYVAFKDTSNKEQEVIVGKFNTISYEKGNVNIVLVPVNGSAPFAAADFANALNDIYKQAAISWTVTMQSQYDIEKEEWDLDKDNKLNDGESTLLSSYFDEQKKLRQKYKSDRDIDNKTYYVFLLNGINSKAGLAGFMPIKGQYGFIYPGNMNARTIAHELGHGAFRLWHTFSNKNDYYMAQNSSDNLMDYNNGQRLHKYQWDYIHDPKTVLFDFLQDEEEGASIITDTSTIGIWKEIFPKMTEAELFKISRIYDTVAVQFDSLNINSITKDVYFNGDLKDWSVRKSSHSGRLRQIAINIATNDKPDYSSVDPKEIYIENYTYEIKIDTVKWTHNTNVALHSYVKAFNFTKPKITSFDILNDLTTIKVATFKLNSNNTTEPTYLTPLDYSGVPSNDSKYKALPSYRIDDYALIAFYSSSGSNPDFVFQLIPERSSKDYEVASWLKHMDILNDTSKTIILTTTQLEEIFPNADTARIREVVNAINKYSAVFNINTPERMSHFLGQIGTETTSTSEGKPLSALVENCNYTESNIKSDFAKRITSPRVSSNGKTFQPLLNSDLFDSFSGTDYYFLVSNNVVIKDTIYHLINQAYDITSTKFSYAGQGVKNKYLNGNENCAFFSYVYCCNKSGLGNGDVASGEGALFRGRGFIHLTGRSNYTNKFYKFWQQENPQDTKTLEQIVTLLETDVDLAMKVSMIFWKYNGINQYINSSSFDSNNDEIRQVSVLVNGGNVETKPKVEIAGYPSRETNTINAYNVLNKK